MTKELEKLIDAGISPEELFKEANRIKEAKDAAKKKLAAQEKECKLRKAAVDAVVAYLEEIGGSPVSAEFKLDINDLLAEAADVAAGMNSKSAGQHEKPAYEPYKAFKVDKGVDPEDVKLAEEMLKSLGIL